jgi:hypothetical protein
MDYTNRLQVFDPEGKHLCTRSDLGLHEASAKGSRSISKGIAWSADGEILVVDNGAPRVFVWQRA